MTSRFHFGTHGDHDFPQNCSHTYTHARRLSWFYFHRQAQIRCALLPSQPEAHQLNKIIPHEPFIQRHSCETSFGCLKLLWQKKESTGKFTSPSSRSWQFETRKGVSKHPCSGGLLPNVWTALRLSALFWSSHTKEQTMVVVTASKPLATPPPPLNFRWNFKFGCWMLTWLIHEYFLVPLPPKTTYVSLGAPTWLTPILPEGGTTLEGNILKDIW